MSSARASVPARTPASEAVASWGCAGNKAPFVMPRLGVLAAGTLLATPAAGPRGRRAGTIGSSPSDAFGTLGKVGHCVLLRFQEAVERQAREARKVSSSLRCTCPARREKSFPRSGGIALARAASKGWC